MNSIFWFGVALGFLVNITASQCWEFVSRYRAWKAARKLVGTWVAYNMHGLMVETTPMPGAGLTVVSAKGIGCRQIQRSSMSAHKISTLLAATRGTTTATSSLIQPSPGLRPELIAMPIQTRSQSNAS